MYCTSIYYPEPDPWCDCDYCWVYYDWYYSSLYWSGYWDGYYDAIGY